MYASNSSLLIQHIILFQYFSFYHINNISYHVMYPFHSQDVKEFWMFIDFLHIISTTYHITFYIAFTLKMSEFYMFIDFLQKSNIKRKTENNKIMKSDASFNKKKMKSDASFSSRGLLN